MRVDVVGDVFLVVEQLRYKSLWVNPFLTVCLRNLVYAFHRLGNLWCDALVKVSLEFLARIVVYSDVRVECCKFLALGNHAQHTSDNNRRACIDLCVASKDLGKVLRHALSDAVMLAFANGSEVAKSLLGCLVELFEDVQYLLALWRKFAVFFCCTQFFYQA